MAGCSYPATCFLLSLLFTETSGIKVVCLLYTCWAWDRLRPRVTHSGPSTVPQGWSRSPSLGVFAGGLLQGFHVRFRWALALCACGNPHMTDDSPSTSFSGPRWLHSHHHCHHTTVHHQDSLSCKQNPLPVNSAHPLPRSPWPCPLSFPSLCEGPCRFCPLVAGLFPLS